MYHALLTLHVTGVCLVVGTLFVQSLAVIFRLRLTDQAQIEGAQWIQRRIYLFIYYPILVITIISGLYLALTQGLFSIEGQRWLHWKLMFLIILIIFGFMNGKQISDSIADFEVLANELKCFYSVLLHYNVNLEYFSGEVVRDIIDCRLTKKIAQFLQILFVQKDL